MTERYVVAATIVMGVIAATFAVLVLDRWIRARKKRSRLLWLRAHTDRALQQLESRSRDDILAGLQTVAFVNNEDVRRRARDRVEFLMSSDDEQIAHQARATLARITNAVG